MGKDNTSYLRKIESLTAARVLIQADSGTTFMLGPVGKAITLPLASAFEIGTWFRFVQDETLITTAWIITGGASDDIHGNVMAGAADDAAAGTTGGTPLNVINFVHTKAEEGDWCELVGDGVNWYLSGQCNIAAAITVVT